LHPVRSTFYVDTDLNAARNVLGVFKSVKLLTSAKGPGFATQESKELYLYHYVNSIFRLMKNDKAVPLHAMEALGGRGGIAPTLSRPRN
jgi:hypothetical protein